MAGHIHIKRGVNYCGISVTQTDSVSNGEWNI